MFYGAYRKKTFRVTKFPLGSFSKPEIRQMALDMGQG